MSSAWVQMWSIVVNCVQRQFSMAPGIVVSSHLLSKLISARESDYVWTLVLFFCRSIAPMLLTFPNCYHRGIFITIFSSSFSRFAWFLISSFFCLGVGSQFPALPYCRLPMRAHCFSYNRTGKSGADDAAQAALSDRTYSDYFRFTY